MGGDPCAKSAGIFSGVFALLKLLEISKILFSSKAIFSELKDKKWNLLG